jgi:hypothetical protein
MKMYVRFERSDLARSPVLYVGDEPAGLATVGLRAERAYCKGFRIIPQFRGRGLAAPLCGNAFDMRGWRGAGRTLR